MAQQYLHLPAQLVLLPVWFVFGWMNTLPAQTLQLAFNHLGRNEGLSQGTCPFISRDSRGFVWIATIDGLNRFDGKNVRVYRPDPARPHSLFGNNVTSSCYEDPETGDLWFTTNNAVHRYIREYDHFDTFQLKSPSGKRMEGDYYAFQLDGKQRLWLRTGSGKQGYLHCFDTRTGRDSIVCLLGGQRCVVIPDKNGSIRQVLCSGLTKPGLELVELGTGPPERHYYLEDIPVREMYVESDTLVWLGLKNGIAAFNPQTGVAAQYIEWGKATAGSVWSVYPYGDRMLFVSTKEQGLWVFDRISRRFVQQFVHDPDNPYSLAKNEAMNLYIDPQENLWVAHWRYGLSYVNLLKNKFFIPEIARGNTFWQVFQGPDGNIWCCTSEKGIFVYAPDGKLVDTLDDAFPGIKKRPGVLNRLYFPKGEIFGFYLDNLVRWNGAKRQLEWVKKMQLKAVDICTTSVGKTLVATETGIFEMHPSTNGGFRFDSIAIAGPVQPQGIWAIYSDRSGNVYLSDNGERLLILSESPKGGFILKKMIQGTGDCKGFLERSDGQGLWIASTAGLLRMGPHLETPMLMENSNGLPNATYYGVAADRQGRLWLSSNQGLLRYDTALHRYLPIDGLFGYEFNTGAFYQAPDGKIWAGGVGGLVIFNPDSIQVVHFQPRVQFTQILVDDSPMDSIDSDKPAEVLDLLDLPYSKNTLSFEFVALEFSNPTANTYRYRLLGYDDQWVENGTRGFARYANLPPGDYTFEVLAANSDGVWSTTPKQLKIHIRTPFYMTWWFYLLCAIAAAGLIYAWFRYRLEEALKIERMRVQISSDLHDDVGTLLSGLAMQSEVLELTAPEKDKGKLRRIGEISRDAMTRMRDTVWAIDARKDKLEDLLDRMREHAEETLTPRGIRFSIEAGHLNGKQNLPTHIRQNLYLIYKEAITNAAKHSNGDSVSVSLKKSDAAFEMWICDNGTVEEKGWKTTGQGTSNMQMRAEKIGGTLEISRKDGYCVALRIKSLG